MIGSFLPCMFFILPLIYGGTLFQFVAMLQHGGLKADSWDHRESTRTVYLNPILGWLLYLNMNYHIEHHIFPKVPCYNLKKLRIHIKKELPDPCIGLFQAYKQIIPAIFKQAKDKNYYIKINLPVTEDIR